MSIKASSIVRPDFDTEYDFTHRNSFYAHKKSTVQLKKNKFDPSHTENLSQRFQYVD